jgi:hypothetical protein
VLPRFAPARLLRATLVPIVLAAPPLLWVVLATERASLTTLGRDQGIFQYVAWALRRGAVDYRDVRDVNGPLTHLVHVVFLVLGGADEHRFRVLDLCVTGLTFAVAGACVAGIGAKREPGLAARLAWALAGWVVLSGQYLRYGYWDLAQRESFFDWFLLPAVALQMVAQSPSRALGTRARLRLFAAAGALSLVPWFGKPTYAVFTVFQVSALLADRGLAVPRRRAFGAFAIGAAAGALVPLAFLLAYGDVAAYLRVQLADVPAMYRFIWPRAAADIFSNPWCATQAVFALGGAVVLLGLVALGEMPLSVLAAALLPVGGLASVVVQAKGFPYHFHPVTAGVALQWLVFVAWLEGRTRTARRQMALLRLVPLAAAGVVALRVATALEDSPHIRATWLSWGASTAQARDTAEYFAHFPEPDFFPWEMRQAAAFLRETTGEGDTVQTYGMDPYLLFLAGRTSATPYIYAYDLDADAALGGGTGGHPDDAQAARIRALRDEHETEMLKGLVTHPPAAFVFFDRSPLISRSDAFEDFEEHCARSAVWVRERYVHAEQFGHDDVWLRRDLAAAHAAAAAEGADEADRPTESAPAPR